VAGFNTLKSVIQLVTLCDYGAEIRTTLETLSLLKKGHIHGMAGYCGIGSLLLHKAASSVNIKTDFILGTFKTSKESKKLSGHCWVEFENNIIDVTASQFGMESRVYVSTLEDDRYRFIIKNDLAIVSIESSWPNEQKLSTYAKDLILISKTVERVALEMMRKRGNSAEKSAWIDFE